MGEGVLNREGSYYSRGGISFKDFMKEGFIERGLVTAGGGGISF